MKTLKIWLKMGRGRLTAMANELNCSLNNIYQLSYSTENKDEYRILRAIKEIEKREINSREHCKHNILKATKFLNHPKKEIKLKAKAEIFRWSKHYANHE